MTNHKRDSLSAIPLNGSIADPALELERNLRPQCQSASTQPSQDGVGVSTVQGVGVYPPVCVKEVISEGSAIGNVQIIDGRIGYAKEQVVEQVVGLCLKSQRESLRDLGRLKHAEVHSTDRLTSNTGIPANIAVWSLEESSGCIVIVDPTCRRDWISGVVIHQPAI